MSSMVPEKNRFGQVSSGPGCSSNVLPSCHPPATAPRTPLFQKVRPLPNGKRYSPVAVARQGRALLLVNHCVGAKSYSLRTVDQSSARFSESAKFMLKPFAKRRCSVISREWSRNFRMLRFVPVKLVISGKGLRSCATDTVGLVNNGPDERRL